MVEDVTILASPGLNMVVSSREKSSHVLIMTGDGSDERRIPLGSEAVLFGRQPPCSVILSGGSISRQHCQIDVVADQARVLDLGSTNGTFVNGTRIEGATTIQHGAIIRLGNHTFSYECRTLREVELAEAAEQELQSASRYVNMLLPKPIHAGPVRADWLQIPCAQLGGNAFGYRAIDSQTFAGYMIDVAGRGTEAAMHSVAIMNLLRQREIHGVNLADPAAVLAMLNRAFAPQDHNGIFFSCCYFGFDLSSRMLSYAAGGRHPAYLQSPGVELLELHTSEPPIGLSDSLEPVEVRTQLVPPSSQLFLFSEGVSETVDRLTGSSGNKLLSDVIRRGCVVNVPEPTRVYHDLQRNLGTAALQDDDCAILSFDF